MIAALFDCDGTLFSNQQGVGMVKYAEAHGHPKAGNAYYRRLYPSYLLSRLGLISPVRFLHSIVNNLGEVIMRDLSADEGEALFRWVANEHLLATKRVDTAARLAEHQAQGHTVLLISAMFLPCLRYIADHFGVEDYIGTEIEVRNRRYTGRVLPPPITGPIKAEKARQLFSSRGMDVDWASSYAYGDSFTDHNMLELVGHPVAVYPDKKLNQLAMKQKWELMGTPKA